MIEQIETVAAVKARQVVWTEWMSQAVEGLADNALVRTSIKREPFGSYLMAIEPVGDNL